MKDKDKLIMDRGIIKSERGTGRTSIKGLYAGGDAGFGAALFITAIRHGQESARAIDSDLLNTSPYQEVSAEWSEISPIRDKTYLRTKWALPQMQPATLRIHNQNLVEYNYTPEEAKTQANRCLQCHVNPVFDGALCIKCNGCVDVCPTLCLKLVGLHKLEGDIGDWGGGEWSAILKDEDRCIRCALCAQRCPTTAITMERFQFRQEWRTCPIPGAIS